MPHAWTLAITFLVAMPAEVPRVAWVADESIELLVEPDDAAYSTGRLARGLEVTIRRDGPDGWATIDPPPGSFSLIDEADVEELDGKRARVTARYAAVRPGRDGAPLPGPPRVTLKKGTLVKLLDRRPLVVRRDGEARTWLPIAPPRAEVRFVRADALADDPDSSGPIERPRRDRLASGRDEIEPPAIRRSNPASRPAPPFGPIDGRFASAEPDVADAEVSPEMAEAIRRVADRHRRALGRPMDRWELAPVEDAYRGLLRGADDADRRAVEARIAKVKRQRVAASAARTIESLIAGSRARDGQVLAARERAAAASARDDGDYDASGLLQTSSKLVEGRRVYALIGDDGGVACYLSIPPGIPVEEMLSRRVGVRGSGRYDEGLRARVIRVSDLEILRNRPAAATPRQ